MKNQLRGFVRLGIILIISLICFNANATNYYFSAAGLDGNLGTIGSPWKTTTKFNTMFASRAPGDSMLFRRGDTFYGSLVCTRSGTAPLPIVIGAYGSGANPIITGLATVNTWTNVGTNIWESTGTVASYATFVTPTLSTCNMVLIGGVNRAMGRTPNSGYYTYQSFVTNTQITSTNLNAATINYTGAELVIRKNNWITDRCAVTSCAGTTLNYTSSSGVNGINNYGFFLQNDVRTLDVQNEWYYNPVNRKLRIFSAASPTNVQAVVIDTLVNLRQFDFLTFCNLQIVGSNKDAFTVDGSRDITIKNCNIDFHGKDAIWGARNWGAGSATNFLFANNTINHTNNNGITVDNEFTNAIVRSDTLKNIGTQIGMGGNGSTNQGTYVGMSFTQSSTLQQNVLIELNVVDSIGYSGITFFTSGITVRYNFVQNYCLTKIDGGGIYTWFGPAARSNRINQIIHNNIVMHGHGSNAGTTNGGQPLVEGFYMDDGTGNVTLYNNTAYDIDYSGFFIHNDSVMNVHDNTAYDCKQYQGLVTSYTLPHPLRNLTLKSNIFFSRLASTKVASFESANTDIPSWGTGVTVDSNYYARPIDDNLTIQTSVNSGAGGGTTQKTLAMWKTYSGWDAHANKAPVTITNVNQLDFEYNATNAPVVKTLPAGTWVSVKGVSYSGTTTLQPFTSLILMNTGVANVSPTANAGIDQTIQLPTSSVSLVGSGTDTDGTIASYAWTQVSGAASTITSPSSASTTITGLAAGVYQYKLTVTDNLGAIGSDNIIITVNPANIAPTANAGTDKAVTLPTSSVTLTGSGTDVDGTITGYLWTRISGPNTPTIVTPTTASTSITGLIAGTYVFRLTVTDNQALTGFDEATVIVSASPNIAPTANAGVDQTIQLPTSSVNLVGSGNDPDGTIASYAWTQVSGAAATITSPTTASTSVTGLTAGVYQFTLTVTDNGGLLGSDNIIITVNPANIPPTANAGTDQTITLPTSTVTLSGSASDVDGTIASHLWTKISGTGGTITSAASYSTTVTGLTVGVYVFRLTATDNQSATGFDEMTVTVNAAPNLPPTANAGPDQTITYPTTSVSLTGSGTDPDGTIASYAWVKLSGGTANIISPTSAATSVTALAIGVYVFQLTVTDNIGATNTDNVQITLNQGAGTITHTVLSKVFNNAPQGPTIVTTPPGLTTSTIFNGVGGLKTNVGKWEVITGNTDPNYIAATITDSFEITPAPAVITVTNAVQQYDSTLKNVTAVTSPIGLPTTITGAPQRYKGTYNVHVIQTNPNYSAPAIDTTLTITPGQTSVSWTPGNLTYPTVTGAGQTNATSPKPGVGTYIPPAGTLLNAGIQPLRFDFTPSDTNIAPIIGTIRNITVSKGVTSMTVIDTVQDFDGNVKVVTTSAGQTGTIVVNYTGAHTAVGDYPFTATYVSANWTAPDVSGTLHILPNFAAINITNFANRVYTGFPIVPTVTSLYSYSITYNGSATPPTNVSSVTAIARITDGIHTGSDTVTMTIIKANPPYTWPVIAPIVAPTPLSATQLNITSTIPISVTYNPVSGTVLAPATHILSGTITPTDLTNYNIITVTNTVVVTAGNATISVINTPQVYNGLSHSITATTTPANLDSLVILYNGSSTKPINAGAYPFTVNLVNGSYTAPQVSGTMTISKINAILTWPQPTAVQDGTAISSVQQTASSNIAGTFSYYPAIGFVAHSGLLTMQATFTPTDTVNYNSSVITIYLSVFGSPFLNYILEPVYPVNNP